MSRRSIRKATQSPTAASPANDPATPSLAIAGICILLAAMVWMVFGQTLGHEFVNYDDNKYVYENPEVSNGITSRGIVWAFTYGEIGHWHPVTWLSHMLDCQVYGLQPWGHHLTNVLLHAATAILLFLVLRRMTGTLWRSAFVAAVFAVHPLHVESVAWVSERKDVLSGLFFILTLGAYERYARGPLRPVRYLPVALIFVIGLMCKGMLVTLPFVLLLLDWWPLHRLNVETADGKPVPLREIRASALRLILEKIPLFALSAISCIITSLVPEQVPAAGHLSVFYRLENAAVSCVIYLRQMVYPAGLAIPYPYPANGWPAATVVLAVVFLSAASIFAIVFGKKHAYLITGWFWYLGMLVPVSGIVQISYYARADRYTYLPQIGLCLLFAWAVADLSARLPMRRLTLGAISVISITALMLCAHSQTAYWKNNQTLWNHTLAVTTGNTIAHDNLGSDFLQKELADEATAQFEKALEIDPNYVEAWNNLGNAFLQKGKVDEAIAHYQKALEISPENPLAHSNLGFALQQKGEVDEAIAQYQQALEINPDMLETCLNLGIAYHQKGEMSKALTQFQKAVDIDPRSAKAHNDLGLALLQSGKVDEAIGHFNKALEIEPGYSGARYNLNLALQQKGK